MNYRINKLDWLNRVKDDFDGETLTIKLMKGTVPTIDEVYNMAPTTRATDELATISVILDGTGVSKNESMFTPTATGSATWMKIISGAFVIATDRVGLINSDNSMIWLTKKDLVLGAPETMYLFKINMAEVTV